MSFFEAEGWQWRGPVGCCHFTSRPGSSIGIAKHPERMDRALLSSLTPFFQDVMRSAGRRHLVHRQFCLWYPQPRLDATSCDTHWTLNLVPLVWRYPLQFPRQQRNLFSCSSLPMIATFILVSAVLTSMSTSENYLLLAAASCFRL
ncbi:hypothetical protein GALMADRAFT_715646 [Galerina marginata CBS 339.88]|uniref:Uncharacterized protein n=1 Tax=Galerina marginata (strain CBS 339.88) TaxID=685588 RepID=A0A067TZL4_GALM3|nr:hypothetical protein GALMADRAFT_715646 [Galerina marginata CBS 339.88]